MSKPIKVMQVNAPKKDTEANPSTYARFLLIPEYKAMQQMWPDYDIHLEILIDKTTVGKDYIFKINDTLHSECTELISRYMVVRK